MEDRDNDGAKDVDDAFPDDASESRDTDVDGIGDNSDAFVNNVAASIDADHDGLPDEWNESCDTECQSISTLVLDVFLEDKDNDGSKDNDDAFPDDPSETLDTDVDGVGDNVDAFVNNAAASIDADDDGLPDAWNYYCNSECRANSGLTLDALLEDRDNDGAKDGDDAFPDDPSEKLDTDSDGEGNNTDIDDDNDNLNDTVDPSELDASNHLVMLDDIVDGTKAISHQIYQLWSYFGSSVSGVGDINDDGFDDVMLGVPLMSRYDNNDGGGYIVFGHKNLDSEFEVSTVDGTNGTFLRPNGVFHGNIGLTASGIGDVNDDGVSDAAIGSPSTEIFILKGRSHWERETSLSSGIRIGDDYNHNGVLHSNVLNVEGIKDFNGDNIDDVLLTQNTSAFVLYGHPSFSNTWSDKLDLIRVEGKIDGNYGFEIQSNLFSSSAGVGDLDGDGKSDIVFGDRNANINNQGESILFFGF